jgi:hypothetical protein
MGRLGSTYTAAPTSWHPRNFHSSVSIWTAWQYRVCMLYPWFCLPRHTPLPPGWHPARINEGRRRGVGLDVSETGEEGCSSYKLETKKKHCQRNN